MLGVASNNSINANSIGPLQLWQLNLPKFPFLIVENLFDSTFCDELWTLLSLREPWADLESPIAKGSLSSWSSNTLFLLSMPLSKFNCYRNDSAPLRCSPLEITANLVFQIEPDVICKCCFVPKQKLLYFSFITIKILVLEY